MVEYDKVYHESVVDATKVLKTVGGLTKPSVYNVAAYIYQDKLARLRNIETNQAIVQGIGVTMASLVGTLRTSQPDFVIANDARSRAQDALKAERDRFELLEKEFANSFGK